MSKDTRLSAVEAALRQYGLSRHDAEDAALHLREDGLLVTSEHDQAAARYDALLSDVEEVRADRARRARDKNRHIEYQAASRGAAYALEAILGDARGRHAAAGHDEGEPR